jgi:hypothetical protein
MFYVLIELIVERLLWYIYGLIICGISELFPSLSKTYLFLYWFINNSIRWPFWKQKLVIELNKNMKVQIGNFYVLCFDWIDCWEIIVIYLRIFSQWYNISYCFREMANIHTCFYDEIDTFIYFGTSCLETDTATMPQINSNLCSVPELLVQNSEGSINSLIPKISI